MKGPAQKYYGLNPRIFQFLEGVTLGPVALSQPWPNLEFVPLLSKILMCTPGLGPQKQLTPDLIFSPDLCHFNWGKITFKIIKCRPSLGGGAPTAAKMGRKLATTAP